MQRDRVICSLAGRYAALYPDDTAEDLRIRIDQHLVKCQFTGLGSEEGDVELMQDLLDETVIATLGQGINR